MLDKMANKIKNEPYPSISEDGLLVFIYKAIQVRLIRFGFTCKMLYLSWKNQRLSRKYPEITDEMVQAYIKENNL